MSVETFLCRRCRAMHYVAVCPRDQLDADEAERQHEAVERSWFAQWATRYLVCLGGLAGSGVKIGKEIP